MQAGAGRGGIMNVARKSKAERVAGSTGTTGTIGGPLIVMAVITGLARGTVGRAM